jgi:hypothetical protein
MSKINFTTNPPTEIKTDYTFAPIYLNVKYTEREEAKALGAFYNAEFKAWYIPNNKVKTQLLNKFAVKK